MSDLEKADPRANQWCKSGHWVLIVTVNLGHQAGRDRGWCGNQHRWLNEKKKEIMGKAE